MQEKILITDQAQDVNDELDNGWKIVSIIPQCVSISTGSQYSIAKLEGKFVFHLQITE
jgi:hypothetical protein